MRSHKDETTEDRVFEEISDLRSTMTDLDNSVIGLSTRVDSLEVKVDSLEVKVDNLEVKVDNLEVKVDGIEERLDKVVFKTVEIEHRLDTEMFTKDDARAMESRLLKGQDVLIRTLTRIEEEMAAWRAGFGRHEDRIFRLEKHTGLA